MITPLYFQIARLFNKTNHKSEVLDRICLNSFFFLLFLFLFFIYSNYIIFCIELLIFAHVFLRLHHVLNEYFVITDKKNPPIDGIIRRNIALLFFLVLSLFLFYFQIFDNLFLNYNLNII